MGSGEVRRRAFLCAKLSMSKPAARQKHRRKKSDIGNQSGGSFQLPIKARIGRRREGLSSRTNSKAGKISQTPRREQDAPATLATISLTPKWGGSFQLPIKAEQNRPARRNTKAFFIFKPRFFKRHSPLSTETT